jgi:hypothetical protein
MILRGLIGSFFAQAVGGLEFQAEYSSWSGPVTWIFVNSIGISLSWWKHALREQTMAKDDDHLLGQPCAAVCHNEFEPGSSVPGSILWF